MPDPSLQNLIGDLTSLIRELTNILGAVAGPWTPDGNNGGVGSPDDWRGHGSAGGLDQDGGHHHHHSDLWKPQG
jgi:hypothetical protein